MGSPSVKAKGGRRQSWATDLKRRSAEKIIELLESADLVSKSKSIEYYIKKYFSKDIQSDDLITKIKSMLEGE